MLIQFRDNNYFLTKLSQLLKPWLENLILAIIYGINLHKYKIRTPHICITVETKKFR